MITSMRISILNTSKFLLIKWVVSTQPATANLLLACTKAGKMGRGQGPSIANEDGCN